MQSHYDVLGVAPTASFDEIRAAYRRLAAVQRPAELAPGAQRLQRMGKGAGKGKFGSRRPRTESTWEERQAWLKIQQAFDVLANPRRREPYDRRLAVEAQRSGVGVAATEAPESEDLAPLDVSQLEGEDLLDAVSAFFEVVVSREPPPADDHEQPPAFDDATTLVSRFYDFWLSWSTRRAFRHAERHGSEAIGAAENRQVRRLMEAEDEKLRRQARKAYSLRVREAAKHAQQHDPRVRQQREERRREELLEAERRAEEREAEDLRREEARHAQRQAARAADEARWASQTPEFLAQGTPEIGAESMPSPGSAPLCCVACHKGFKTRDAWLDHAASKRHRYNARRWEESGRGSPLLEGGSPPLASPGHAWSASPAGARKLSSPLELPEAAWLPPGGASPELEPLPAPAIFVGDVEASTSCMTGESPTSDEPFSLPKGVSVADTVATLSEAGQVPSLPSGIVLPPALEALAVVPSHVWVRILGAIGCSRDCAHAAVGLLSSLGLREGELGEPSLWARLSCELWGRSASDGGDGRPAHRRFLALAAGADEARDLWGLLGASPTDGECQEPRKPRFVRRQPVQGFQALVLDAAPGLVAASQRDSEVKLFSGQLARLPPLRTRGKRIVSLAVEPGGERLAVGAADGQVSVYSVTDPEEMPSRLQRPTLADASANFAGLLFSAPGRLAVALRGDLGATLYDAEIAGAAVASSSASLPEDSQNGLLTLSAVGAPGGEAMLLLDSGGHARIWDVRTPRLASVLDLGIDCTASAVDPTRWTFVASSPTALHWGDLRAQCSTRTPVEHLATGSFSDPPLLTFGARGSVLAFWASQKAYTACLFAGSHAPLPVFAGETRAVPLAACRTAGGGPLILSLAQQVQRRWDFELCAVGVRAAAQLPSVLGRVRQEKPLVVPAQQAPGRRHMGRGPPRDSQRRSR